MNDNIIIARNLLIYDVDPTSFVSWYIKLINDTIVTT